VFDHNKNNQAWMLTWDELERGCAEIEVVVMEDDTDAPVAQGIDSKPGYADSQLYTVSSGLR
jgi:hypothetical protein